MAHFLPFLTLLLGFSIAKDAYKEHLSVYRLPNNFYLNKFTFDFSLDENSSPNYMPLHIVQFAKNTEGLRKLELDLV